MTDQNPSPTQRIPVPEPNELTGGIGSESTSSEPSSEPEPGSSATDVSTSPVEPRPGREDRDRGRSASILFGLIILGIGLWFFAEHTLGYQLPRIRWSQLWPLFIIGIGLWVVLGSMRRGSR